MRKKIILGFLLFVGVWNCGFSLSNPVIEELDLSSSEKEKLVKKISSQEEENQGDAEQWYELGILQVKANRYEEALYSLEEATSIDPDLVKSLIQQAYIYLWLEDYTQADAFFHEVIVKDRWNKFINDGLEKLAHHYEVEEGTYGQALAIYEYLIECLPDNCDYYLYLGRLLNWMDHKWRAEATLEQCLALCPDYFDAALILSTIYIKQERRGEAKRLLMRFADEQEAQVILGGIALYCKNYFEAQGHFQNALLQDCEDKAARRGLGKSLYNRLSFKRAKRHFLCLMKQDPCDEPLFAEYFYNVKPYTNWALLPEFSYTQAKESDPDLEAPVVRTLYVSSNLTLLMPICDRWRVDVTGIFFRQREKDIFPPTGINYNVYMSGAAAASHLYLTKHLRWDLMGKVIQAWGEGEMNFPFDERTSFEPGSYIVYDTECELFVLGGNYESFVIKNFARDRSELQRLLYTEVRYGRRFKKLSWEPEIHGWAAVSAYRDDIHNVKNLQSLWVKTKLPFCKKRFSLFYLAERSGFRDLNINYYSYKNQWQNTLGILYFEKICSRGYIELAYEQRWRSTRNLFLPVGDTVFVARKLFVRAYRPSMRIGYRIKDKVLVEVGAHYYKDTFPYRDYNINANILWYF